MADNRNEMKFKIVERIGVIATNPSGWTKEINPVSWNGGQAKYDIRDWDPDHEHISRGITLSEKDMNKVREMLNERESRGITQSKEKKDRGWER